ncbi:MAG TPA: XdhC family protein [Candidatus Eisenbacteria bacterium]|jgi:xanthine dehydrogenase accessory factor
MSDVPRDPEPGAGPAPASGGELDAPGRTRDADVWDALARWRVARRPFVLATVVKTRGFTPRKAAAHMLIAKGGETVGTIGGGAIEREVLERAGTLIAQGGHATVARHLTQELGMCCGGEMSVFLEAVLPAPRLYVFGAGYIAKPLAAIAVGCGFEVTVVDARPDWATGERFPTSAPRVEDPEGFARALETTPEDFAVIVTHDHAVDQRLVQALIRKPLCFLGMIGSIPKQRKFALRLRARGFADEEIARLHTPLGLAIGAATPEEIAVSVVAQLVAVRRGAAVEPGWVPPARRAGEAPEGAGEERALDDRAAARVGRPEGTGATPAPNDREVRR